MNNLAGRKYTSRQKLGAVTFDLLGGVPEYDYDKAFKNRIKRLKLCVSLKGEYFDDLKKNANPSLVVI